ncbi:phosphatase [Lactococcus hodotermopsidis]|uniref:Phosphatase n=1 Tax=Pseudolactococcus hodotermopsidis TaxID=2709157 RepID=A0A6A0BB60_9LACT|nr:Cof-type HAD-IIB family hydrolase [Lactococcus hodotermopsidis]GFH41698.1 phosphatase [Lactococcus hodotermopsidis]
MTDYKIAFFDIDGTLADNDLPHHLSLFERIPNSAKQALLQLKENGIEPVIATGRNKNMVEPVIKQLQLDSLISSNGQLVTYKGTDIYEKTLSAKHISNISNRLTEREIPFLVETKSDIYGFEGDDFPSQTATSILRLQQGQALPKGILQFSCIIPVGEPFELHLPDIVAVRVAPNVVNIHATDTSKATGIHEMLQIMNIAPNQAICFGDEANDFEMFEAVGTAVAMGNAVDLLKEKADYVTDIVGNDGIFKACQHFGLI